MSIKESSIKKAEKTRDKPVFEKSFISNNRVSFPENARIKRCTPHFFIYHIPTHEINSKQITRL
jgi:hypothetical protein